MLLHESDRAVVVVAESGCTKVGESASHGDVSGRLRERQAEPFLPQHHVELVGLPPRGTRVEFGKRLFDLRIDFWTADLAEIASSVGRVDLLETRQRERVTHPSEECDVESAGDDVVREEAAGPLCVDVELHPDLGEAVLGDLGDLAGGERIEEDEANGQWAAVLFADGPVKFPAQVVEILACLNGVEGGHTAVVLISL